MEWHPIVRNPIDLPSLQRTMGRDFHRALTSKYETAYTDTFISLLDALTHTDGSTVVSTVGEDAVEALQEGGSYFVADEMTTMLHRVAQNVPNEITFHPRVFPQESGFLYLEEPFVFHNMAIVGWTWFVGWVRIKDILDTFADKLAHGDYYINVDKYGDTPESIVLALLDDGAAVRGKGDDEEIATVSMTFWIDPSHEDDFFLLGEHEMAEAELGERARTIENALHTGLYGVSHFNVAPISMHHAWFPGGVRIDNDIHGSFPSGVGEIIIDEKNHKRAIGRQISFMPPGDSLDIWKFVIATFEMLNSRIVMEAPLNRAQQKQLHRVKFNQKFKIIRLRKIIRKGDPAADKNDPNKNGYKIDYRYMVPPTWQRYHTRQGVIWKMKDWYMAGPDGAPFLDRETVYQLDR